MKKKFQGILDFCKGEGQITINSKINETILVNLSLRMGKEYIDVVDKKVNIFIISKANRNEVLYSSSVVKCINAQKGLVQVELPGFTFHEGEYLAEIEILDIVNNNFLSCNGISFNVEKNLNDKEAGYLISQRKIETLFELDRYVTEALQRLSELEKKMEGGLQYAKQKIVHD